MPGALFETPGWFRICLTATAESIEAALPHFRDAFEAAAPDQRARLVSRSVGERCRPPLLDAPEPPDGEGHEPGEDEEPDDPEPDVGEVDRADPGERTGRDVELVGEQRRPSSMTPMTSATATDSDVTVML